MPLYEYRCAEDHVTSARRPVNADFLDCPTCGASARRAPFYSTPVIGVADVPYDQRTYHLDRAMNAQTELQHQAAKQGKDMPDVWQIAKQRASAIQAQS